MKIFFDKISNNTKGHAIKARDLKRLLRMIPK